MAPRYFYRFFMVLRLIVESVKYGCNHVADIMFDAQTHLEEI